MATETQGYRAVTVEHSRPVAVAAVSVVLVPGAREGDRPTITTRKETVAAVVVVGTVGAEEGMVVAMALLAVAVPATSAA